MIINIMGENVLVEDVSKNTAYFMFKDQFKNNNDMLKYHTENTRMYYPVINEQIPYILNGNEQVPGYTYDQKIYYPAKYIELQNHLMKHQTFKAKITDIEMHILSHGGADLAMDKLISIDDDYELYIICLYLMKMSSYGLCNGDLGKRQREPVLERVVEYLIKAYPDNEMAPIIKAQDLNKFIQELFIKYDDTFNFADFPYDSSRDIFSVYPRNEVTSSNPYDINSWSKLAKKKYYQFK